MDRSAHPDLHRCLERSSWRHLLAVMASHGLPCSTRWKKAALVETLHTHLAQPDVLRSTVARLSEPTQDVLAALLRADGALPTSTFTATFGAIRPSRPWRKDAGPQQPWQNPTSPTERLWYLGLLYLDPPRPAPGVTQQVVVPADLLAQLQRLLLFPQSGYPVRLYRRPGRPANLAWHVALLLATLEEAAIRPLHGRWLPPRTLAALASRSGLDQAASFQLNRSERRLPYLAFLHYLAQAAGLVAGQRRLGLTALAWQWLAAAPPNRWQSLWQAWLSAPSDLGRRFEFPWAGLMPQAANLVLTQLRRLPLADFTPLAQVVEQAHLSDEYKLLAQPWDQAEDVVATLIAGPLFWFRIVDIGEERPEAGAPVSPSRLLRLTPMGAWLLERPDCGPPLFSEPQPCLVRPPNHDVIRILPAAQPLHLARLVPICEWLAPQFPAPEQRLRLSEERVGRTVAEGTEVAQIFHALEAALNRPPSRRMGQRLRVWAQAGQQVRVRHLTVLETHDPERMGQLRSRKLIRRHLGDALSPTRSELNPAGLPALLQTLRSLGLYAAPPAELEPPADHAPRASTDTQPAISGADASLLYMAGLVYRGLGAHVPLPASLSAEIIDTLADQLTPAQREAAEHSARQVLEQLRATLQGYLAFPAWQIPNGAEDILPMIEAALAGEQDLVLTYWGAGREQTTVRQVTPYWLEQRHNALYLIAYCHLREAERVFRVDRIHSARPTPAAKNHDSVIKVP